eukprot:scaffold165363_cov70-Attheya_sp.AAC.1
MTKLIKLLLLSGIAVAASQEVVLQMLNQKHGIVSVNAWCVMIVLPLFALFGVILGYHQGRGTSGSRDIRGDHWRPGSIRNGRMD